MDALISALPLLIILACPLMMIFMMRGMHGGRGGDENAPTQKHDAGKRSPFDQSADQRIAELEREVAALREQEHDRNVKAGGP